MDTAAVVGVVVLVTLVIGGAAVGVGLVRGALSWRRDARVRWDGLDRWARETGWCLRPGVPNDVHERFKGWPLNRDWGLGGRATQVVVEGRHGDHQALAFEYVHTDASMGRGSLPMKTHYRIAALALPMAGPSLEVKRRRRGGKMVELDPTIRDLPVDERFAATFAVWTDNPGFMRHVLTLELMTWLLSAPASAPLSFRFEGNYLLCWQRGALDAGWVVTAVRYLETLLGFLPPEVLAG